ncbi:hypothetical protein LCGC14_2184570, partial [marine sediment metagenome]
MEFIKHTDEEHAQALADFLPEGKLLIAKNIDSSIIRNLLRGVAKEYRRLECDIVEITVEHNINVTEQLIDEWERALGIPDDCFVVANTIEERRENVILKLASQGTQTEEDFEALALRLGFVVDVFALQSVAFPPYDV